MHVWSARTHVWGDGRKVDFSTPAKEPVKIRQRLEFGEASSTIMRVAASEDVDLIVMGTRGTTQSHHKAEGHVAREVAKYAVCPVVRVALPTDKDG
jgi:nucleotide-binding universal stress UspA family protein